MLLPFVLLLLLGLLILAGVASLHEVLVAPALFDLLERRLIALLLLTLWLGAAPHVVSGAELLI